MSSHSEVGASSHEVPQFSPLHAGCYPGHWTGRFIWDRGESLPYNAFLMFRKTLDIHEAPSQAVRVHITAALKYKLWVNGRYVASGPARSSAEWKSYDTHDVSRLMHAGRNTLAVLCWFTGVPNNYACDERAGLWAQLEYLDDNGGTQTLGSDETWRVRQAQGFQRDVPSYGGTPPPEIYDARLDPPDWMSVAFDDSRWENACCLTSGEYRVDPAMMASWTYLEPRQTPPMREREVAPVGVVFVGEADAGLFGADEQNLQGRIDGQDISPLRHARAEGVQSLITNTGEPALFQNNQGTSKTARALDPCVTLDFGRTYNAFPCIEFEASADAVIEIAAGGFISPDGRVTWGDDNKWSCPARYVAAAGRQCWRVFEPRPVRFLQVVFRNIPEPIRVFSVRLISWEYPAEQRGSFACSDDVLTKLWQAGVDTAYLHMDDTLIFDVVRERETYAYIGEAQQGHQALAAGYGDLPFAHWHLKQTLRAQVPSGLVLYMVRFCERGRSETWKSDYYRYRIELSE